MQIIPKSSFTRLPWKNGGGVTNEACREPPGADPYRWRVSVAEIGVAGPFSSFADYHRTMALLTGGGVRLSFGDGGECYLRETGDLVEFDGAIPTECELLAGPCTDLNLIVSKAMGKPAARIDSLRAPRSIVAEGGRTTLVFAVRGSFFLVNGAATSTLEPWDLAVLAPGDAITLAPVNPEISSAPLVFCATLDHNY